MRGAVRPLIPGEYGPVLRVQVLNIRRTAILNGELTMSVCQEPYEMAYTAVDSAVKALRGQSLDAFVDTGASIVEPTTAQARLDMLKGYLA